nr:DNA polymerase III subunit delta [Motiliproteus sp. SC1-56]
MLSGDEPLLIQEAADQLRQQARSNGYAEREVLHAEAGFQWESLLERANSLSLFSEKLLLELHIPNGKPGPRGSEVLETYLKTPSPDTLLLIYCPRLDASAQKSKWFKAIDQAGATLAFWPVEIQQLPRWIQQRCAQAGLEATTEAARLLAERVEGNLLAAIQEIEKLRLLHDTPTLTEEHVLGGVADSSRYDIFALTDAALQGDPGRCLKILQRLQTEGAEPSVALWALSRELRTLTALAAGPVNDVQFKKHRIFGKRKAQVNRALKRLRTETLSRLLQQCARADSAIKGRGAQPPWQQLTDIALGLATG